MTLKSDLVNLSALTYTISVESLAAPDATLRGAYVESPVSGTSVKGDMLQIIGWVLGKASPVKAVGVVHEGVVLCVQEPLHFRKDIAVSHRATKGAGASGFRIAISLLRLPATCRLLLQAYLSDGSVTPIATLKLLTEGSENDSVERVGEIAWLLQHRREADLLDAGIDTMRASLLTYAVKMSGWVQPKSRPIKVIEFLHHDEVISRTEPNVPRPDVVVPAGKRELPVRGFWGQVNLLRLPREFELKVQATFGDGSAAPLATLRGSRRAFPGRAQAGGGLQPLMISTLGRTGSTWLATLLGCHPAIVAYRPFGNETRMASYWLELARAASEPASVYQALNAELTQDDWWTGQNRHAPVPLALSDPAIERWFGRDNPDEMVGFAQDRIAAFYREVTQLAGKSGAAYFVEKSWPGSFVPGLLGEIYPRARELFLVRDFRDMICSIFAYNRKLGYASFGRELAKDDKGFIRELRKSALLLRRVVRERGATARLVRYEDLIQSPQETLCGIMEFLGLDSQAATLDQCLAAAQRETPEMQRQHITSKDVAFSVGRWKRDLDRSLQKVCDEAFGDIMAEFGYV